MRRMFGVQALFWLLPIVFVVENSVLVRCRTILPTAVNTTLRLEALRGILREYNLTAYIIPTSDAHQSEYVADHDLRRTYVSGFTGSAGEAVVTLTSAALWTDSRYYIQAEEQLDGNWLLMRTGEKATPSKEEWLSKELKAGDEVSADAKLIPYEEWDSTRTALEKYNINMRVVSEDLIDYVWTEEEGRPSYPDVPLMVLDIKYAGLTWQEKLEQIRDSMKSKGVDTLLLTALDEVAWTLNLRGGEVPFTPVFRSYLVLEKNQTTVYIPSDKITSVLENHLNSNGAEGEERVRIRDYEDIWGDLEDIGAEATYIGLPSKYSYGQGVSYLIHSMLPADKIVEMTSPALLMKDKKNDVESAGMRLAHIRDGVALSVFFARLEKSIKAGNTNWTELGAVNVLDQLRFDQPISQGPSFPTIAASGTNAAMPHYEPTPETDKNITANEVFLVDSGGQYLDGTTDVTRTVHFGQPTALEKNVYTKLLMGCIDIVTTVFPEGQKLSSLEILIRRPLYSLGLDYGHGSTHGIGSFLVVHEAFNSTFHLGFFGSQEPGYYKENEFGMRLENIVTVVPAETLSGEKNYLTFETVTLAPYESGLIEVENLERSHKNWINSYHAKVQKLVGDEMLRQGYNEEYSWLLEKTKPI